ncbi:MAG: alpha glucosidase [Pseudobdellovibrionaceae bacterium]|jgi:alpha-glucosidase|nr:alpha glucosidase [Pseudobdellovibrionaceae bacterium]
MTDNKWWRGAVIYQIYPRSFLDMNGDGIGDLPGIERRLDYLSSLGIDAIWISPFFKSPMKDFGYDVSDYRTVDPIFGHIDDFDRLLRHAHERNIKIIIDEVWSHTSDQHLWFHESRMNRDNAKKDWYVWADAKPDGTPPNNWLSYFGGPAWTWDARREQYYLHHFLSSQPALNLWNPEVQEEIFDIAKFWLDRGVDGFRLDVIHTYQHDPELRDNPIRTADDPVPSDMPLSNPMSYQKRVHSMCTPHVIPFAKKLRAYVDQWPDRCLLGEAGGDDSEAIAASYVQGPDRLHMAYSFGLLGSHMTRQDIISTIKRVEEKLGDGWLCWATSNHDTVRAVTRTAAPEHLQKEIALMIMALGLSLRGSYCMFQGEELGLPQAKLAFEDLRDPYDMALYPEHAGRDGGRTPMPWHPEKPHGGFTFAHEPWIKFWEPHRHLSVWSQEEDPQSVLSHYKNFIAQRKQLPALIQGDLLVLDSEEPFVAWVRELGDQKILCMFNVSPEPHKFSLPEGDSYSIMNNISNGVTFNTTKHAEFQAYGYGFFGYTKSK